MYHHFPEDTRYAVLFREMVSINYYNLIKIVFYVIKKIMVLFLELEYSLSLDTDL